MSTPESTNWRDEYAKMLAGCSNLGETVGIAIGAGSMCWENPAGAGEFDSTRAGALVDALVERIQAQVRSERAAALDVHTPERLMDLLETAWGVIANAGGWRVTDTEASPEWREAAEQWRDQWLEVLSAWCARHSEPPKEKQ